MRAAPPADTEPESGDGPSALRPAPVTVVGSRRTDPVAEKPPPPPDVAAPDAAAPDAAGPALWQWDPGGGSFSCTPPVTVVLGLPLGVPVTLDAVREVLHPADGDRFEAAVRLARAGPGDVHLRVVRDDEVRHVHAWWDVRIEGGRATAVFGGVRDTTGPRAAAAALEGARATVRALSELTGAGRWQWCPGSGELTWSAEMFRLVGLAPGAIRPTIAHWHRVVHADDLERARRLDVDGLHGPDGRVETFRITGADGRLRFVQGWATTMRTPDGTLAVIGTVLDVSRAIQDRRQLDRLSATDSLTGLDNRRSFERRLAPLLTDSRRDVGLLLLDLDRFKQVNDSLGHQIGDRMLVEVARRLRDVVPAGSITARMGGDEFVVVPPPGTGWLHLRRLASDVVQALRAPHSLPSGGDQLVCPASIGVTSTSGREVSPHDLLSEADLALYQAKDGGRDRYAVFDDRMRARARARHDAERLLRAALDDGRLELHYQPVADLRTLRVVGAEALVRIRLERGGLVLPDAFIDVAEDTGLVVELDCWVIDSALDQLARRHRRGGGDAAGWIAVNVSARSMENQRVARRLIDGLARRGLPPGSVKVELTERSFLGALPGGDVAVRHLLAGGVPVGIDDFGTGYSALAYLQHYDLDFMKIDRSFVAAVGQDRRADAVVTAIVDLAHAHGMQVTAEGVESARQARRLAEIGCDLAQGWHVGRPGPADLTPWTDVASS